MKIAIIGYGKMGKAIEQIAADRGHTISAIIDLNGNNEINAGLADIADVAIEFTSPASARQNILDCIRNNFV